MNIKMIFDKKNKRIHMNKTDGVCVCGCHVCLCEFSVSTQILGNLYRQVPTVVLDHTIRFIRFLTPKYEKEKGNGF